ncbi:E3 ubiquitin-protein ligase Midline-1-like isoform X4 [Littorina saxatilis]|uniref:E3 ubiquitin-protein ligase Midline-1-like isoform X4 n=1 Tax=Littorina saxatilis TaxID=31220 RepID=UPI0038B4A49A
MASAAIPFDGNDTECSVCHELFKNPKLLPCAHVLCRHCLLSWLASNPGALCPLCRGAIADPKEKSRTKGWEEVVDALPDDVAMAALVESTRVLSRDHVCAGCEDSGAVSICLHCGDMLCASCTRAHGNLSATRQHTVETLATMTAERLATNQFAACCVHSDKPSELYCPTHGAAICHLCASSEHRACPEVTLFEKRLNELQQELSAMSEMLKAAEGNLDKAISQLDQQLEEAERNANKSLAEIDEACDRLEKSIKACRRRLRELTLVAKEKVEESVQATRADMLSRRGRMTSHRRVVDRVKVTSPPGKLEKATTTVRLRVQGLNLRVTVPSSILSMKTIKVDNTTLARLEKELTFLGEERHISGALSEAKTWQFMKSENIVLSNGNRTAEKVRGQTAIVLSSSPMKENMLYEVQIDTRKGKSSDFFPCGVVKSHPDTLKIPKTALDGWADAVVFSSTVFQFGSEKDYNIDKRLRNLKEGTRVGFVRDAGGFLHLYIDGEKQWIYARNLPKDCYVFFELLHTYQKD